MTAHNRACIAFPQDPDVARLVKLLNVVSSRPLPVLSVLRGSAASVSAVNQNRPTYEEMMAIVNRRHPRK